jgi:hypothetical protein
MVAGHSKPVSGTMISSPDAALISARKNFLNVLVMGSVKGKGIRARSDDSDDSPSKIVGIV